MQEEERKHYQYETKFQHIDESLEDVQNKLGRMFFNPDDWACWTLPSWLWWMQRGRSRWLVVCC